MGTTSEAWDLAHAAAASSGVQLTPLDQLADADDVRSIIDDVWGAQVLPRELIRAFQHAGCVLWGARDGKELVGFVLGFLGFTEGIHLHSHMLAVLPESRSRGVGMALKLAQRARCLDEGVEEVRWTFDPLVGRNARFNLVKLGAVATGLLVSQYGEMTDKLNAGDRSDRFEVRWWLRSRRVERALAGAAQAPAEGPPVLSGAIGEGGWPRPDESGEPSPAGATAEIPADHSALRESDRALGQQWREVSARAFARCFEAGLVATWFGRDHRYVFEPAGPFQ